MSVPYKLLRRNLVHGQTAEYQAASTDLVAGEVITRVSDRGSPQYGTAADPLYPVAIANSAALPAAPTVTTDGFPEFIAYASVAMYWRPGTATHTSINVTVYALTSRNEWVQVGSASALPPNAEVVVAGVGYRRIYVQVTAVNGGATGSLNLYLAGV